MAQLFADAARAYLSAGIIAGDTTISISTGGNLFPTTVGPDFCKAVLQDATAIEIVYITAHASAANTFTVTRGQEGTTARAFAAGSVFGLRVTAADTAAFAAKLGDAPSDGKTYGRKDAAWAEVVSGGDSAQVGDVRIRPNAPAAGTWLLCDGSVYLQSSYTALFAELGILYNAPGTLTALISTTMSHLDQWHMVCFGGGIWVALTGNGGTGAASSTNGIAWTARTISAGQHHCVVYGADKFVVVAYGDGAANPTSVARSSTDGITWTNRSLPYTGRWPYVAYGNGVYVAINSAAAQSATSSDGVSWTGRTTPATFTFVGFLNGQFIALTGVSTTTGYKSTDGISWSTFTLPTAAAWSSVAYANGVYVAVAGVTSGIGATSPDGVAWTQRAIPTNTLYDLTSGGGTIMSRPAGGYFHITADGINWSTTTIATGTWARPGFGQGKFVTALVNSNTGAYAYAGVSYNRDTQFVVPKSISNDVPSWIKAS